jgi:hypothetical protein
MGTKFGQKLDRKTNNELANLSVSTGETREALLNSLSQSLNKNNSSIMQQIQRVKNVLPIQP